MKASVSEAEERRSIVSEKFKTLLALGSLLLGVVGMTLPKYLAFESVWLTIASLLAVGLLLNIIVLILVFLTWALRSPSE